MILAGDIGGTNTRLALVERGGDPRQSVEKRLYDSGAFADLAAIVRQFLTDTGISPSRTPVAAAFGVPGPVRNGRATATNLHWSVDASRLSADLGIRRVEIRNDLEMAGLGIGRLGADRFSTLNEGVADESGNGALIAAGTGLGQAILLRESGGFRPLPSEGGQSDFAPRNNRQDGLLKFLRDRHGTVSCERVVSGPGLHAAFEYLVTCGEEPQPRIVESIANQDPALVISTAALRGDCSVCVQALSLFADAYAAEAANLALTALATGGVFLGGGIAPKIVDVLRRPRFMEVFRGTGPLRELLASIPVTVILDEGAALIGAAGLALSLDPDA